MKVRYLWVSRESVREGQFFNWQSNLFAIPHKSTYGRGQRNEHAQTSLQMNCTKFFAVEEKPRHITVRDQGRKNISFRIPKSRLEVLCEPFGTFPYPTITAKSLSCYRVGVWIQASIRRAIVTKTYRHPIVKLLSLSSSSANRQQPEYWSSFGSPNRYGTARSRHGQPTETYSSSRSASSRNTPSGSIVRLFSRRSLWVSREHGESTNSDRRRSKAWPSQVPITSVCDFVGGGYPKMRLNCRSDPFRCTLPNTSQGTLEPKA